MLSLFHSPEYLWLLLLIPVLAWRRFFVAQDNGAIPFSNVETTMRLPRTLRQRLIWLPDALLLLALVGLIVALARPRDGRQQTVSTSEGIAIELVVDRSGSMQAMDFRIDGERVDRLQAIKNVVTEFVLGGEGLEGRFSDLVGLATFAGYADAVTPPTLDHSFLVAMLNQTRIVDQRNEDGTAIGDAIALATEKLNALDARGKQKIKSKIIILLTDGESNAGTLDPLQAAELAETLGIKVYTIGVGTKGEAPFPVRDPFSGRQVLRPIEVNIDEETLTKIAERTGGKYFRATDTDSLEAIYREIDELEKTKVESKQFVEYRELAVEDYPTLWGTVPPILSIVLCLIVAGVLLKTLWLRELT
ncbi:VWA domain-containing protein [Aporhodopirellula aestuarii]|uniref:VWA domain-containing protein n=1 Tax=Aporhodopirellula aestuarii TaxID=2950107 RepID=A0ABT0U3A7_9BACT|nr:VWA domain-containing protein [Aporhodopirellula aestuarii]MCM2371375.1 VWA domain-containing protein [Aporhodopirellula aestuarii]